MKITHYFEHAFCSSPDGAPTGEGPPTGQGPTMREGLPCKHRATTEKRNLTHPLLL